MSNLTYSIAKSLLNTVEWTSASNKFRVLLVTGTYVPSAAHQYVADVVANEATGTGYARKLIGTKTRAANGANFDYKAVASSWTLLTSAFRYAIVYQDVAGDDSSDATAWLVCALDLGAQSIVAALFTLNYGGASPGAVLTVS